MSEEKSGSFMVSVKNARAKGDLKLKEGVGFGVSCLMEKGENPVIFIHFFNEICMAVVELDDCLPLNSAVVGRSMIPMEEIVEFRRQTRSETDLIDWICASIIAEKGVISVQMKPSADDLPDQVEVLLRLSHIRGGFCTSSVVPFEKLSSFLELEPEEAVAEGLGWW